jgi:acetyl-CoA acetyltransferase
LFLKTFLKCSFNLPLSKKSKEVVIVNGVRTAIGESGGILKDIAPTNLAGLVIKAAVQNAGIR